MSSNKAKKYAIRNSPPKTRPPKYPHLPDKLREIIDYFSITQQEIHERTGIPQASISKCLRGKGSLVQTSLSSLSTQLPEPIPLWWLTSGPEGATLKEVLSKEREKSAQEAGESTRASRASEVSPQILHNLIVAMLDTIKIYLTQEDFASITADLRKSLAEYEATSHEKDEPHSE